MGRSRVDDVEGLMAREIPRLRRYALALSDDPDAADDLVQDCLERAIRKSHLWRRHGSIRSWLYRILYNVFVNQSARRRRAQWHVPLHEAAAQFPAPARQEVQMACSDLAHAIKRLNEEQRIAIVLTAVEEMSYDEAADMLGIPIGTLRSRLSRGRERLRNIYAKEDGAGPLRRLK